MALKYTQNVVFTTNYSPIARKIALGKGELGEESGDGLGGERMKRDEREWVLGGCGVVVLHTENDSWDFLPSKSHPPAAYPEGGGGWTKSMEKDRDNDYCTPVFSKKLLLQVL